MIIVAISIFLIVIALSMIVKLIYILQLSKHLHWGSLPRSPLWLSLFNLYLIISHKRTEFNCLGFVMYGFKCKWFWSEKWKVYFTEKIEYTDFTNFTYKKDVKKGDIIIFFKNKKPVHYGIVYRKPKNWSGVLGSVEVISKLGGEGLITIETVFANKRFFEADEAGIYLLIEKRAWFEWHMSFGDKRKLAVFTKNLAKDF